MLTKAMECCVTYDVSEPQLRVEKQIMSKRLLINGLAAMVIMLGAATASFAANNNGPQVSPQNICSGGGGTCGCTGGCHASSGGCSCDPK